jgi:AbiV family abortive infection protein
MDEMTLDELEALCAAVVENASRLVDDAELLVAHGRYPSASYLARVATEEAVKPILLTAAGEDVIRGIDVDWERLGVELARHPAKTKAFIRSVQILEALSARPGKHGTYHPSTHGTFHPSTHGTYQALVDNIHNFTDAKNASLYADFKSGSVRTPRLAITEEQARFVVGLSRAFVETASARGGYSADAIRHMTPTRPPGVSSLATVYDELDL